MLVHEETGQFCGREIRGGLHRLPESHASFTTFLSCELLEAGRIPLYGRCCAGAYIWPGLEQKCPFLTSFEFVTFLHHTGTCFPACGCSPCGSGAGSAELHSSWVCRGTGSGASGLGTWASNWFSAGRRVLLSIEQRRRLLSLLNTPGILSSVRACERVWV